MPLLICPNCNTGMQELNRNGVLLDACPQCRGIWLDRGELEKVLTVAREADDDRGLESRDAEPRPTRDRDADRWRDDDDHAGHGRRKPRSKLERIFDIFD